MYLDTDSFCARLEVLQELLGGRDAAMQTSCKQPQLLEVTIATLHRNVEHLQQLLGLEQASPDLTRVLRRLPGLLICSPDTLCTKLQQLC